ncbi:hypothetical protein [Microlunatus speluncae]|uniref:hypothetical protein n=1 Tax=Microlunatus speluncae TaxID=2594267 RepID=UPI0013763B77|nr:hypothetical protein [Microlunatus speluncae]
MGPPPPAVPVAPTRGIGELTLDLFARGENNQLYHRWWTAGKPWTQWESLRGELASGAGAGSHNAGIVHLGVLGSGRRIHDRAYDHGSGLLRGWSNWKPLGTKEFNSAPTAASWGTDHFAMFARGTDNKIWHNRYRFGGGGWTDWQPIFAGDTRTFSSGPAAVAYDTERLHVFAKGIDNLIYDIHTLPQGGWSMWTPIGTQTFGSGPAAASWGTTHLALFAVGTDQKVWTTAYRFGTGWAAWTAMSGDQQFTEAPAAGTHKANTLNVFALGTNGEIWERAWNEAGQTWTAWASTGAKKFTSGPACTSWSNR